MDLSPGGTSALATGSTGGIGFHIAEKGANLAEMTSTRVTVDSVMPARRWGASRG